MAKGKEVVKAKKAAPPPAIIDDMNDLMEQDAGAGLENIRPEDMAIPFIVILQALSPQVKRGEQQIEDAKEGDIYNTVTGGVFAGSEGVIFIPVAFKKAIVEWRPREEGGGFIAQHDDREIMEGATKDEDSGKLVTENGNVLVDTAYHYGLLVDPVTGDYENAVIAMTSTQLKKSRKWNSLMSSIKMTKSDGVTKFTPPIFSQMYRLTTVPEENAVGSWSGWDIEHIGPVASLDIYQAAKLFAENINKGLIKIAPPQSSPEGEDAPF